MQSTLSMAWLCCKHFRDRLEHLENLQSSSFARLLLDSMQQFPESTLFSTVTGTHPLRTSSACVLAPEQMCCDWQLLAVQPIVQSNGARPCKLAATKRQLSHFLSTNGSGEVCPFNWSPLPFRHLWWAVLAVSHGCGWWQFSSTVSCARAGVFSRRGWHENFVTCLACCRSRARHSHYSLFRRWCGHHCLWTGWPDISPIDFADRHSPEDALPGWHQSTSWQ